MDKTFGGEHGKQERGAQSRAFGKKTASSHAHSRFDLNGAAVVRLEVGEQFSDEMATVVSFGRDISSKVTVGGDALNVEEEGIYQLVYTVDDLRWGDYQRVRVVIVGDPEGAEDYANG